MKARVKDYLNVRVGTPSVNSPTARYVSPGAEVAIDGKTYQGDEINGNNRWYRDESGNFLWSGGFELAQPSLLPWWITDFGIDLTWKKNQRDDITIVFIDSGLAPCPGIKEDRVKRFSILNDDGLDNWGHGTLMASIAAGVDTSLQGVAPKAKIVSIKMTNNESITATGLTAAIYLFLNKIRDDKQQYIVNLSCSFLNASNSDKVSIIEAIKHLTKHDNILVCAASGNDYLENSKKIILPAACENVVSVAGFIKVNGQYQRLISTNYWSEISISAPAEFPSENLSLLFNRHIEIQGSSHACAFMSGFMALLWSADPSPSKAIREILHGMVIDNYKFLSRKFK